MTCKGAMGFKKSMDCDAICARDTGTLKLVALASRIIRIFSDTEAGLCSDSFEILRTAQIIQIASACTHRSRLDNSIHRNTGNWPSLRLIKLVGAATTATTIISSCFLLLLSRQSKRSEAKDLASNFLPTGLPVSSEIFFLCVWNSPHSDLTY